MTDTSPRPFVFILMPFDEKFDDKYNLSIKPACEDVGAYAERVDEQIYGGNMLMRVYNQIAKADLIIADMTGQNPNVFYEVGYAHALNKSVILITSDKKDIPFDLQQYHHVIYDNKLTELKKELVRRIPKRLNENKGLNDSPKAIKIYHNGKKVKENSLINVSVGVLDSTFLLQLDIQNVSITRNEKLNISWSLTTPNYFERSYSYQWGIDEKIPNDVIKLPDGNLLHKSRFNTDLEPDGWTSLKMGLNYRNFDEQSDKKCSITIRMGNLVRNLNFDLRLTYND